MLNAKAHASAPTPMIASSVPTSRMESFASPNVHRRSTRAVELVLHATSHAMAVKDLEMSYLTMAAMIVIT